jgi:hypothetical protein
MRAIVCAVIVALCAAGFTLNVSGGGDEVKPKETDGNTRQKPASKTAGGAVGAAAHITAEQLKDYLDFIASDELEGRDTPSRGPDIAAKFIALNLSL